MAVLMLAPGIGANTTMLSVVNEGDPLRLTAVEIGLAVLLVTGAGLLASSLGNLERVDPGFRPEGVLVAEFAPDASAARDSARLSAFHGELLERTRGRLRQEVRRLVP